MAKILVADDNSNVQKTVTLALVELGVEVVAVNNGDAAVRKLADFSPDLVLADIFMPVRNGYEVCEYVKKDPRFSHVPVVLLVGAFDPLDEREAQRVGADGILKKPFVPPDPLITMVKTLLDRTMSERLVAVTASKTAATIQAKTGGVAAPVEKRAPAAEVAEETPEEQFTPPLDRVSFGEGAHPIAFGQLLDAAPKDSAVAQPEAIEPVNDDQILTSTRDASLGDPIFWKSEPPAQNSDEENSEAAEEESSAAELPMRPWKLDEEELTRRVEADALPAIEPFELVREGNAIEAEQTPLIVEAAHSILQDPAAQAALTVQPGKLPDLAENPIEWMASVPPPPAEPEPIAAVTPEESDLKIAAADAAGDASGTIEVDQAKSTQEAAPVESPAFAPAEIAPFTVPVSVQETAEGEITPQAIKLLAQNVVEESAPSVAKVDWANLSASLQNESLEPAAVDVVKPIPAADEFIASGTSLGSQTPIANSTPAVSAPQKPSADETAHPLPKRDWADLSATLSPASSADAMPAKEELSALVPTPVTEAPPVTPPVALAQPDSTTSSLQPPAKKSTAEKPEDTAHSLPRQDWADMMAALEPVPVEPVPVKPELPSASTIPAFTQPPAALPAEANAQSASTVSIPPFAKTSTQTPEETAHSLPKRDWAELTATLEPIGADDVLANLEDAPIQLAPPPPAVGATSTALPAPSLNAAPAPPAPISPAQGPDETAHSAPKHDWSDLARGIAPKSVPPVVERPKPAPGILAHGPIPSGVHTQPPSNTSAQVPPATLLNSKPLVSAPPTQIPGAQNPGAPAALAPSAPANGTLSGQPDPALVEAVVQRVLDKMRPQVVDIITKEFLRPVVQALVHREITKR